MNRFHSIKFKSRAWQAEKSKTALIASRDLGFGLSRMYELLLTGSSTNRAMEFRNYDETEERLEA